MKLASVQALKESLKDPAVVSRSFARSLGVSPAASVRSRTELASASESVHAGAPSARKVALGVAPGRRKGDFHLGARVHGSGPAARKLAESIREEARGEADVRVVPRIAARAPTVAWLRARRRPLVPGLSLGPARASQDYCGTLGCFVEDEDAYYLLSNNHVLADVNGLEPGAPIVQPSAGDRSPKPSFLIAVLDRFVPISFTRSNVVDCAIAQIVDDVEFYTRWNDGLGATIRSQDEVGTDDLGRSVCKIGRTTGVTRGRITLVDVDGLKVDLGTESEPAEAVFSDQFEVTGIGKRPFSQAGDSGSAIVGTDGKLLGLLGCGGLDDNGVDLTYANRIERVFAKLGVKLAAV